VDLAIRMTATELDAALASVRRTGVAMATTRVRHRPLKLTPGWTNFLFVAVRSYWRGFFRLSGGFVRDTTNAARPYVLTFDAASWTPNGAVAGAAVQAPAVVELEPDVSVGGPVLRRGRWSSGLGALRA